MTNFSSKVKIKTKYRLVNNSVNYFLQYRKVLFTVKLFSFKKEFYKWVYIKHYSSYSDDDIDMVKYVSTYNYRKIIDFTEKYPYIDDYFIDYIKIREIESKKSIAERIENNTKNKKEIIYL